MAGRYSVLTQTTTTVTAPVIKNKQKKKNQWIRRATGPHHRLQRERLDQAAGPSTWELEEAVRQLKQEAEITRSLTSAEL